MSHFIEKNALFKEVISNQKNRIEQDWKKNFKIMFNFLELFDNPHLKLKNVIHITGTNGKGSVCAFLKEILLKSGYTVNVFTSPHLIDVNERFFVQNEYISNELLEEITSEILFKLKQNNLEKQITYFEVCTLIAMYIFSKKQADFNIIEVGLGGRLDATNVFLNKICSIITSISKDHEEILGKTKTLIAKEKIAIAKDNELLNKSIIFCGEKNNKIINVCKKELINLKEQNIIKDFEINILGKDFSYERKKIALNEKKIQNIFTFKSKNYKKNIKNIKTNLFGTYQFKNASLVCEVALFLNKKMFFSKITNESIKEGLLNAKWNARLQFLNFKFIKNSKIILDGCHNEDGIKNMCKTINKIKKYFKDIKNIIGICAFIETKNITNFMQDIKNTFDKIICTDVVKTNEIYKKFVEKEKIHSLLQVNNINSLVLDFKDLEENLKLLDSKENLIIIFGSLYLSGEILKLESC